MTGAGSGHIKRTGGQGRGDGGETVGEERAMDGRQTKGGPWWDEECRQQRDVFHEGQRRHNDLGTDETRVWMCMQSRRFTMRPYPHFSNLWPRYRSRNDSCQVQLSICAS